MCFDSYPSCRRHPEPIHSGVVNYICEENPKRWTKTTRLYFCIQTPNLVSPELSQRKLKNTDSVSPGLHQHIHPLLTHVIPELVHTSSNDSLAIFFEKIKKNVHGNYLFMIWKIMLETIKMNPICMNIFSIISTTLL